ncbi:hypothetical protein SCP20_00385 [Legionella pneumophila serogroup 1]|uniref:hypothetical protein n=1 Tax=Legionella pneumophila TaxID=446 RepID=UPI000E01C83B|nr:hypothetical protein [Legionella pneumophila]HAT9211485.1 hypothetical protein [Legionella pneumophila subsp. pneumophila]STX88932.1 Uncharacterised protein [Legionella pneumophila]HAT9241921.1 hypothetical protein [Legionella pneumophila subsp. pneumophila]HAT9254456.1 hypothetical protein [Legionella pneumophila subsp. pneumophila]HAT9257136.1 hypothetical protein [Legionella pneumophila subsp. pneumophila]
MNSAVECLDLEAIKAKYNENEAHFNLLRGTLISCARKIKIFSIIATQKHTKTELTHEDFWGWLQIETLLPNIILSCYELAKGLKEYNSTFLKLLLPDDSAKSLTEKSKLQYGISALYKQTKKFVKVRNKRIAHLECAVVDSITADLEALYKCLARIDLSLSYIMHYLLNPYLISEQNWSAFDLDKPQDLDSLDAYFEHDPSIWDCKEILMCGADMVPKNGVGCN